MNSVGQYYFFLVLITMQIRQWMMSKDTETSSWLNWQFTPYSQQKEPSRVAKQRLNDQLCSHIIMCDIAILIRRQADYVDTQHYHPATT